MADRRAARRALRAATRFGVLGALVFAAVASSGCNSLRRNMVRPDEREYLADRIMRVTPDAQEAAADEHVLSSREGAIGGSGPSAGGCGCN